MWVVTWNQPGYLPEGDPIECDTYEDAVDALREEIERYADEMSEDLPEDHSNADVDEIYEDCHDAVDEIMDAEKTGKPFSIEFGDYVFEITEGK